MRTVNLQEKSSEERREEYKQCILQRWDASIDKADERWQRFKEAAKGERREELQNMALMKFDCGWEEHGELIAGALDTVMADEEENIDKVNYAAIHLHDNG